MLNNYLGRFEEFLTHEVFHAGIRIGHPNRTHALFDELPEPRNDLAFEGILVIREFRALSFIEIELLMIAGWIIRRQGKHRDLKTCFDHFVFGVEFFEQTVFSHNALQRSAIFCTFETRTLILYSILELIAALAFIGMGKWRRHIAGPSWVLFVSYFSLKEDRNLMIETNGIDWRC